MSYRKYDKRQYNFGCLSVKMDTYQTEDTMLLKVIDSCFSVRGIDQYKCSHLNTETWTTGRMYYQDGECWDDYQDHTVCLDCGAELEQAELCPVI
jgi:hypothetical protein